MRKRYKSNRKRRELEERLGDFLEDLHDIIEEDDVPMVKKGDIVRGGYGSSKKRMVSKLTNGKLALTTLEGKHAGEYASTSRGTPDKDGLCPLSDLVSRYEEGGWEVLD